MHGLEADGTQRPCKVGSYMGGVIIMTGCNPVHKEQSVTAGLHAKLSRQDVYNVHAQLCIILHNQVAICLHVGHGLL